MAKFRRNHTKQSMGAGGTAIKFTLFAALIGGLFWIFNLFLGGEEQPEQPQTQDNQEVQDLPKEEDYTPTYFFPESSMEGQLVNHKYFSLFYIEEHEQAEWVAYELTRESLNQPWVERSDNYRPDPKIRYASASTRDYRGTGYDRGHLVPAGDMAFSEESMSTTFYMSNISPQIHNFNVGIWRELEENVRDWARKFNHLYVVTGPVLNENIRERIGGNDVSVPDAFYKVILDITEPGLKGIGFFIPNEVSVKPLGEYAVSIDEIERITNIDFFPNVVDDELEEKLENTIDTDLWPMNYEKYEERVKDWNQQKIRPD